MNFRGIDDFQTRVDIVHYLKTLTWDNKEQQLAQFPQWRNHILYHILSILWQLSIPIYGAALTSPPPPSPPQWLRFRF